MTKLAGVKFSNAAFPVEGVPTRVRSPATLANWADAGASYALEHGKASEASELASVKNEALNETDLPSATSEGSGFYSAAFDLRNAEMNLEAIASISERTITKESKEVIESHIDKVDSLVNEAVQRAYGLATDALKGLKRVLGDLKDFVKNFSTKMKDQLVKAFDKVLEYFFRIITEFVSRMFTFVGMISKAAEEKGYVLKDVKISFDPPSFGKVTVLGFSIPFPKFSLPKLDVGFEVIEKKDGKNK